MEITADSTRPEIALASARPIVILPNWFAGQSISNWVASGTGSAFWGNFQSQLTLLQASYPGATFNYVVWDQGEADCASCSTAYNTQATYAAGFAALLAQLKATPQWSNQTVVSTVELAPWIDNSASAMRNDVLYGLRNGVYDPQVTMVSGAGLTESAVNVGPHYDGNSLVALGQRHFETWLSTRIGGHFGGLANASNPATGALDSAVPTINLGGAISFTGSISGATLTVGAVSSGALTSGLLVAAADVTAGTRILSQLTGAAGGVGTYALNQSQATASETLSGEYGLDMSLIRNGATVITAGETIAFPHTADFAARSPTIRVFSTTLTTALDFATFCGTCAVDERNQSTVSSYSINAPFLVDVRPINGAWRVTPVYPAISNFAMYAPISSVPGIAVTLTNKQLYGAVYLTNDNAVTLAPAQGGFATFINQATSGATTLAIAAANETVGARFIEPDGTVRDTGPTGANPYSVAPGATVIVQIDNGFNVRVVYDSARHTPGTQYSAPTSGSTVTSVGGLGFLTHVIAPSGTIAALTIALPPNPANGAKVEYVFTQAVTSLTLNGGALGVAPSSAAAGQRLLLTYVAGQNAWY